MKRLILLAAAVFACATPSPAVTTFSDSAANYEGDVETDTNPGSGFGAWLVSWGKGVRPGDWVGCGAWDPSANGFLGTWAGKKKAIGIVGKGHAEIWTTRSFVRPLGVGETFSLEMAVNWDSNAEGARKGFAVLLGRGYEDSEMVVVNHGNYPGHIALNGATNHAVLNAFGLYPMRWTFTPLDAATLRVTATARDDPSKVFSTNLAVRSAFVDGFRLASANQFADDPSQEDADKRQSYFDNFTLELDETRLRLLDGDVIPVNSAAKTLSFTIERLLPDGEVPVTVSSSNPGFVPGGDVVFQNGKRTAEIRLPATLSGSGDSAVLTAVAEGFQPLVWEVRGPVCTLSVGRSRAAPGAKVPFRVDWTPVGVSFDASKISLACEPSGAFALPDGALEWTEDSDGTHADGLFTANSDGTLVLYFDGVRFGECPVAVAEPSGIAWSYERHGDHATITGADPAEGDLVVPASIDGLAVTEIGERAFYGNRSITALMLPDGLRNIAPEAFKSCDRIQTVRFGNGLTNLGVHAFYACRALVEAEFPSSLKSIGDGAFESCGALKTVDMGDGVESVGSSLFWNCEALEKVALSRRLKVLGEGMFYGCRLADAVIPEGVESIGRRAFCECGCLTNVSIPSTVTNIADSAFNRCRALPSIVIPDSVRGFGATVLCECNSLVSVHLGKRVSGIGEWAFFNCGSLKTLTLPASVRSVGPKAFLDCPLETLYVPADWEGTDMLSRSNLRSDCEVIYSVPPQSESVTPVAVPYSWLDEHAPGLLAAAGGDHEVAAAATAANGRDTVWQCYAAGLDPEDPGATSFSAVLSFTNGTPVVAWNPSPPAGQAQPRRKYTVEARKTLSGDEEWTDVTSTPSRWLEDGWRFFRVALRIQE